MTLKSAECGWLLYGFVEVDTKKEKAHEAGGDSATYALPTGGRKHELMG